ncbi:hypothetical protein Pan54_18950 [Rubinisphaera italica]|uniref:Uncharacterized protein n=1 Tax=Rubinisphaera italica TaxID=2527969 RepID=A0A5C5XDT1_9PLAN|nr:hypothetical protein Pan54_18950 [Rubinisphaera italica]
MEQILSESNLQSSSKWSGWYALLTVAFLMAVLWLGVLPKISKDPGIQQQIRLREEQGVDSAAMFYSDLPAVKTATDRLNQLEQNNPYLFWLP